MLIKRIRVLDHVDVPVLRTSSLNSDYNEMGEAISQLFFPGNIRALFGPIDNHALSTAEKRWKSIPPLIPAVRPDQAPGVDGI